MNLPISCCGVQFENPFILASAPPTAGLEMIRRGFEAGWGGAVIKTLIPEPVSNLQNRFAVIRQGGELPVLKMQEVIKRIKP